MTRAVGELAHPCRAKKRRLLDAEVAAMVGRRRQDPSLRCLGAGASGCDGEKSEREDGESDSIERQSAGHVESGSESR